MAENRATSAWTVRLGTALTIVLWSWVVTPAAEPPAAQTPVGRAANLMKPETHRAVENGLRYLKSQQNDDGSFGRGSYSRNVAICSLAAMAFMSRGSMPGRGPYGREVNRCLSYILDHVRESGYIIAPEAASHGPMYGHGFATLFLAEAYGMSSDQTIRDKLVRAVELIVRTQNDEGGWRYEPKPQEADISVTICQIMALRAARNAGLFVPRETVDRCTDYVKRSQNPDGGFMYQLSAPGDSRFPRSAAGVVALYSAGVYEGEEIEKGLEYLMKQLPPSKAVQVEAHFSYGHYYAVQAMWQAGGERWQQWYPAIHDALLARQRPDGAWFDQISPEYGTAMACIILQMPNNYLPIFQR
ncbi:MAG TPA: terpene cyclase/mutase family protein [Candidatus Anammoximicrobium sp.]|nr:terpene cyclase/mutase family protein [Candidatus Anammoximicrobium sp.]